jgi:hypothetical protein
MFQFPSLRTTSRAVRRTAMPMLVIPLSIGIIASLSARPNPLENKIDPCWVYVSSPLTWKAPPRDLELPYEYSEGASVAIIYPSGKLVILYPTLHRQRKTGLVSISRGDDIVVFRGTWEIQSVGHLRAALKWASGGISLENQPKYTLREELWELQGRTSCGLTAVIRTPNQKFVPFAHFEDIDFLQKITKLEEDSSDRPAGPPPSELGDGTFSIPLSLGKHTA